MFCGILYIRSDIQKTKLNKVFLNGCGKATSTTRYSRRVSCHARRTFEGNGHEKKPAKDVMSVGRFRATYESKSPSVMKVSK